MENKAESDDEFARALEEAHQSYARERDALVGEDVEPVPSGGVGGTADGVKCLHAHYAHTRAGGVNPVGALVDDWIGPLDCVVACVKGHVMNPEWVNRP